MSPDISDVILTCVELRYKPDPAQAQALLAEKITPPTSSTLAATVPSVSTGAGHNGPALAGQSSRPVISIPLPASAAAASSAPRQRSLASAVNRGQARGADHNARGSQRPHDTAPASDAIERVALMQQQHVQASAPSWQPASAQPATISQPQKAVVPTSRQPQAKKGYVWKPPAKSRRPTAVTTDSSTQQEKPAAPTRPASPSTPPSPFLSHMSPSSRPPSPFIQSLSPMSASKRYDSTVFSTAASRKRPHSPAATAALREEGLASNRSLVRNDSNGRTEQLLVDQLGLKMRVVSAEDTADREEGEVVSDRHADGDKATMKEEEERKEEDAQHSEDSTVRVILDELHALKGGVAARSDKREELAMMDDLDKFRAELAEGGVEGADGLHEAADDGESAEDIRAWKRARHDERDSPVSPSHHAASMATPWERETDGEGAEEAEPESEFDHSQPSSPAPLDESEHRLDQFAAVKLQSGYNATHEQQLEGGEHADGMDDGEATMSAYPSKGRREPADEMAEHSLLTT